MQHFFGYFFGTILAIVPWSSTRRCIMILICTLLMNTISIGARRPIDAASSPRMKVDPWKYQIDKLDCNYFPHKHWNGYDGMKWVLSVCDTTHSDKEHEACSQNLNRYMRSFRQRSERHLKNISLLQAYFSPLGIVSQDTVLSYIKSKTFRCKSYLHGLELFYDKVYLFVISECSTLKYD